MIFSKLSLFLWTALHSVAAFQPPLALYSTSKSNYRVHPSNNYRIKVLSLSTSPDDITATEEADVQNDWEEDDNDDDEESSVEDEQEDDQLSQEYQQWIKAVQKALKGLQKKQTSLENERSKAQKLEDTVARAQLIVNNLYLFNDDPTDGKYRVVDWEKDGEEVDLILDNQYDSASAEADALFAQARKLKRGSQVVNDLLEKVEQAREILDDCQTDLQFDNDELEEGRFRLVQDRLRRTSSTTQFQEPREQPQQTKQQSTSTSKYAKKPALGTPASNVRKLLTPAGSTILVGRNRRGNEYLSCSYARGNDVWMHARGTPGAHVLVLDRRGSVPPTDECLELAAHLAAFYSDGRTETKVAITTAEPKHLLKPRGAPLGAIKLRQEGPVRSGRPDRVPKELQEARAQSGVYASEEYRRADKAKHRKQTQKVAREKQKQKQQQRRTKKNQKKKSNEDWYEE